MQEKIPAPPGKFFSGHATYLKEDILGFFKNCIENHGDIVRFRAFHISCYFIHDPHYIEEVLVKQNKKVIKPFELRKFKILLGNGLLTNEGESWLKQRRLAQPVFHHKRIYEYGEVMVKYILKAMEEWQDHQQIDIYEQMMDTTLKIAAETLFATHINDMSYVPELLEHSMNQYAKIMRGTPFFWTPSFSSIRFALLLRKFNKFIAKTIAERKKQGEEKKDLLSMFLSARYDDGSSIDNRLLRDEMVTMLVAGHETTALAISWTMYLLGKNPDVKQKLYAEIQKIIGSKQPHSEEISEMPYLANVIKESMRLYPPAWGMGREAIEPITIGKYTIEKGSQIYMSSYLIHRDSRHFESPDAFLPERWTPQLTKQLHKYAYFPFGGGPRLCIGNHFATLEISLLLICIFQKFDFELAENQKIEIIPSITLRPKNGVKISLSKR